MNDDPDITPPHGTPIPASDRAEVRSGPHIIPPHATDAEWDRLRVEELNVDKAIHAARNLLRVARHPLQDAAWDGISAALEDAAIVLIGRIDRFGQEEGWDDVRALSRIKLAQIQRLRRGQRA